MNAAQVARARRTEAAPSPFVFTHAVRSEVSLLIGLAGGTGSGKTYSALRLAAGMSGGKRFAVIDTEAGRARHYADQFDFDHGDLKPPFRPSAYQAAIEAAEAARYPVIVVDSTSHEWEGEGGLLEWQEEELQRMAGDDWAKREQCAMAGWVVPKRAHRKMVNRLLQLRSHLILCFRAEEKIEMERVEGKLKVVPKKTRTGLDGWVPICEKKLPFELTISFLLVESAPGVPRPIKVEAQHRRFLDLTRPLDENVGEALALWAAGDEKSLPDPLRLATEYATADKAKFAELEKRREKIWPKIRGAAKQQLKAASEAAAARLKAPALTTEAFIKAARAAKTLVELERAKAQYKGKPWPLDADAAYQEMRETLGEREGKQLELG